VCCRAIPRRDGTDSLRTGHGSRVWERSHRTSRTLWERSRACQGSAPMGRSQLRHGANARWGAAAPSPPRRTCCAGVSARKVRLAGARGGGGVPPGRRRTLLTPPVDWRRPRPLAASEPPRMPTIVVDVMPKAELLDPQGKAVAGALSRLEIGGITGVRIGKRFELTVDAADEATLETVKKV